MKDCWLIPIRYNIVADKFSLSQFYRLKSAITQAGFQESLPNHSDLIWYTHPNSGIEIMLHADAIHLMGDKNHQLIELSEKWLKQFPFLQYDYFVDS